MMSSRVIRHVKMELVYLFWRLSLCLWCCQYLAHMASNVQDHWWMGKDRAVNHQNPPCLTWISRHCSCCWPYINIFWQSKATMTTITSTLDNEVSEREIEKISIILGSNPIFLQLITWEDLLHSDESLKNFLLKHFTGLGDKRIWGSSHSSGLWRVSIFWDIIPCSLHANFLLGLFFDPEDGGDMFLWNVEWLLSDYMMLYTWK
jgi:hypothetical protein